MASDKVDPMSGLDPLAGIAPSTPSTSIGGALAEWDLKNAEESRKLAQSLIKTWKLNSGFIRGILGDRVYQLPWQFARALDELDAIASKEELTDQELGASLGIRTRLIYIGAHAIIKEFAPDLLRWIPQLFLV